MESFIDIILAHPRRCNATTALKVQNCVILKALQANISKQSRNSGTVRHKSKKILIISIIF
jgi:hypothetical protein